MSSWLNYHHPDYSAALPDWRIAYAQYTGDVQSQLQQFKQAESTTQFDERRQLAQFHPVLADVLDTVAGMPFERLGEVERFWGGMGDPEDLTSVAGRLMTNVDGHGEDLDVLSHRACLDLLLYQRTYALVEGPGDGGPYRSDARVTLLPPTAVPNWVSGPHGFEQVMIRETVVEATSLTTEPRAVEQTLVVTPTGWQRWREGEGNPVLVSEGLYSPDGRAYVSRSGAPICPVVRVDLPFRRRIAAQLARSAAVLYNLESARDSGLRSACFPKLELVGTDEEVAAIARGLKAGSNVVQSSPEHARGHTYLTPGTNGAETLSKVLEDKYKRFHETAFRLLAAESRVATTATEAQLRRSEGAGAILSVLAGALEEFETQLMWLLAQCYSDREADWQATGSTWPRDWGTVDPTPTD